MTRILGTIRVAFCAMREFFLKSIAHDEFFARPAAHSCETVFFLRTGLDFSNEKINN